MTSSKDWVRQPLVDKVADEFVAEGKFTIDTLTAYQVAVRIGCSANPSVYEKFRDWRARRRQEQAASVTTEVPPEAEAEFDELLGRVTGEAKAIFRRTIQTVGNGMDRSKTPRVIDAERRRDTAEAETDKILELWKKTEADLSAALLRIEELEKTVAEGLLREERLKGRIEQRTVDWVTTLRHGQRDAEPPEPIHRRDGTKPSTATIATGPVADKSSSGAISDVD